MPSPKRINSKLIAAIATIAIQGALIIIFSINMGNFSSPQVKDTDDETLLQLEKFMSEDFQITPPPTAENAIKENQVNAPESAPVQNDMQENITTTETIQDKKSKIDSIEAIDTILKRKEPVIALKVDSIKPEVLDSAFATIMQETSKKNNGKSSTNSYMSQKERYEFYKNNYRLIRSFKKVYPYALKTRDVIENLNAQLATMTNESEKKKLIKETEQQLFKEYEGAVRTMSISQGKLLLKLIARETNRTGYELIKEYKGAFTATFWYGVGRIFGTNLKTEYDRQQEDSLIENVVEKYKNNDLY